MVEETVFGGVILFMKKLGFFNVFLPFLLTFANIYAVLDKTQVLGTVDGGPKKDINAMVAFVTGLLVVGATSLISAINAALANVAYFLLFLVMIILCISVFLKEGQLDFKENYPKEFRVAMYLVIIIVALIFVHALGWLIPGLSFLKNYWNTQAVATVIFLLGAAFFIWFLAGGSSKTEKKSE